MGKVLLILVLGTTMTGTGYLMQLHLGADEQSNRRNARAYTRLAEDVSQSGYALGVQNLHQSFTPFTQTGVAYGPGSFDLSASPTASGAMTLRATGRAGAATYAVEGEYAHLARPCDLLGALFLHTQLAPAVTLAGTGFSVRGEDTQPASRVGGRAILDGPGYTVAGVLADTLVSESFEIPLAGAGTLSAGITLGGVSDEGYLRDLIGCLLSLAAEALEEAPVVHPGSRTWASRTFGSPTAPTILAVKKNATFHGTTRGYGILLAGGDIRAEDDFIWEGLVIGIGGGAASLSLADSARVYGAVVGGGAPPSVLLPIFGGWSPTAAVASVLDANGAITGPLGLYRRPTAFSLQDEAGIYASEEALGRVAALLSGSEFDERVVLINERVGLAAGP